MHLPCSPVFLGFYFFCRIGPCLPAPYSITLGRNISWPLLALYDTCWQPLSMLATTRSAGRPETCGTTCKHLAANGFFFQAEDGIRDYKVTGVQTCALPI